MLQGLSQRDNPNCIIFAFCKNNHHNVLSKKSYPSQALLKNFAGVDLSEHRKLKDFPSVGEIEPMLAFVLFVLSLIPLERHEPSVTTSASKFSG
jgi:hypothetical protein